MRSLRSSLIHLAATNMAIRPRILPLLKEAAEKDPKSLAWSLRRAAGEPRGKTAMGFYEKAESEGWEKLEGEAYAKASRITGTDVDVAKKFGRKTVFARFHGTVTLYVVRDDGTVAQDWFMGLPNDNAIREFVRVSLQEPADKTASLALTKESVDIPLVGGKKQVDALVHGPWSIYKNFKGGGYAVTFTPTGQAVTTKCHTLMDAKAFLEVMLEQAPDLAHASNIGDVMRHKDILVALVKNPPALSGAAINAPVPVSEKRVSLIADIKAAGLAPMGTRSGKAGDFFAARGLGSAPTRAISVGNRDVLLNQYDMQDEKWKMLKVELISAISPELLAKWVAWVNAGPSRSDIRSR